MPALLLRAIVTGFGYKIGAELARYVSERIGLKKPDKEPDDGVPSGMTGEPGEPGDNEAGEDGEQATDAEDPSLVSNAHDDAA